MSKIVRPKTPFEFCAYPVLKEALEKMNYNQTELAQFTVSAWVRGDRDTTVRLLLARTDTAWFHDYCYNDKYATINFVRGRLKFGGEKNSAPFPSMVVIFRRPAKALH